ncbi:hypothetical protein [Altericroceibacterium endophyticum]|uniref:Uncharacterized protein n=1 Tax=Altericroceibacterium endophyticum TaxID=1808508 RepID=A0A6I4T9B1_9SPHN|nr:hypothetical protein [Altericroceibacterium endophyticum]MXO66355.1 hypothetical protein [Altericroceibacterium endophyticum]
MMLPYGIVLSLLGPLMLRLGWHRKSGWIMGGWALLTMAAVLLTFEYGAWGLAIGTCAAIASASVLLAVAALRTPAGRLAKGRLPERKARRAPDWPDIARRWGVFIITFPLTLLATLFLAVRMEAFAVASGSSEANSMATAVIAAPIIWTIAMSWQMLCGTLFRMALAPAALFLAGGALWLIR